MELDIRKYKMNKIIRMFNPTPEKQEEDRKKYIELYNELAEKRGCSGYVKGYVKGYVTWFDKLFKTKEQL